MHSTKFKNTFKDIVKAHGVRDGQETLDLIAYFALKDLYNIEPPYNPTSQYNLTATTRNQIVELLKELQATASYDLFSSLVENIMHEQRTSSKKDTGEFYTPREVIKKMINLLALPEDLNEQTFCDPFCGSAGMLAQLVVHTKVNPFNVFGQELTNTHNLALLNAILHGIPKENITRCNTFENHSTKYDYIIANPPFGLQNLNEYKTMHPLLAKEDGNSIVMYTICQMLKPGGNCCIIQPTGSLFNNINRKIREYFVKSFSTVTIYPLPPKTFSPFTEVETCIFALKGFNPLQIYDYNLTLLHESEPLTFSNQLIEAKKYSYFVPDYHNPILIEQQHNTTELQAKVNNTSAEITNLAKIIEAAQQKLTVQTKALEVYQHQLKQKDNGEPVTPFWQLWEEIHS